MNEIEDPASVANRELAAMLRTIVAAGTELAVQRVKAQQRQIEQQRDAQRQAEQAVRDHRKELLRGAPTQHQQRQWQAGLGSGDAVALKMWGEEVYTGRVVTNPNRDGEVSVRFDDPRVEAAYGDVWNKAELHVRKPGKPELKFEADVQPELAVTQVEQEHQNNLGRGDLVETKDRGNIGTVTTDPDDTGQVAVYFYNKDRDTRHERYFQTDDLRVVTPGDPALKESVESFTVDAPKGQQITVTNGPALAETPNPIETKPAAEAKAVSSAPAVTVDDRSEWQNNIGRGDTVKALDRGNVGTVTTDPNKDGEVSVHFVNKEKGTEHERSFNVSELEVTRPGSTELKKTEKPFVIDGSNEAKRTVINSPVVPDPEGPAKEPVQIAEKVQPRETKIPVEKREQAATKIAALRSQVQASPGVAGPNTPKPPPVPRHETQLER